MKKIFAIFLLLIAMPVFCAVSQYKVVIKKTGKIVEGELIWEDDQIVQIREHGLKETFHKDQLDVEKMKTLNVGYQPPTAPKTITIGPEHPAPPPEPSLVDLAKTLQASRTGKARGFKEGDKPGSVELGGDNQFSDSEKAMIQKRIDELQKKIDAGGSATDLDAAKKELAQRQEELGGGRDTLVKHYIQSQLEEYQQIIAQTDKQLSDAVQANESPETIQGLRDKMQQMQDKVTELQAELRELQ